jgi:hypothetical protein
MRSITSQGRSQIHRRSSASSATIEALLVDMMRHVWRARSRQAIISCTKAMLFLLARRQWLRTLGHAAMCENIALTCTLDSGDTGGRYFRRHVSCL